MTHRLARPRVRDQEPAEHEEHVHAEEPAGQFGRALVEGHDGQHGQRPHSIQPGRSSGRISGGRVSPAGLLFGQAVMLTSGYRSSQEKRRVTAIRSDLLGAEQVLRHPGQVIAHRCRGAVRVARPQRGHDLLVVLPVLIAPGGRRGHPCRLRRGATSSTASRCGSPPEPSRPFLDRPAPANPPCSSPCEGCADGRDPGAAERQPGVHRVLLRRRPQGPRRTRIPLARGSS